MKLIFSLWLCFLLTACGVGSGGIGSYDEDDGEDQQEEEPVPQLEDFSTRLNSELLVAGEECLGNENVEVDGQIYTCEKKQWLVTVDNINQCNENGCTEVGVVPIIAELSRANVSAPRNQRFYFLIPISPISDRARRDLKKVLVRFDIDEAPKVLFTE